LKVRSQRGVDPARAGEGWRALSAYYTELAERRTGRLDITCLVAPNATGGLAPGTWSTLTARIELDGLILPDTPDELDPRGDATHKRALSALHGVFSHECGHAVHSLQIPRDYPEDVREEVSLLEEIRMEAHTVSRRPHDARFLRAAADLILLEGRDKVAAAEADERACADSLTLTQGRVLAGSLTEDDVEAVVELASSLIPKEKHRKLARIWQDAIAVPDGDLDSLATVARRYKELFPPTGGVSKELVQALCEAIEQSGARGCEGGMIQIESEGSTTVEDLAEAVKDDVELSERLRKAMEQLREETGKAAGAPGGKAVKAQLRPASAEERRARNKLAALLRKARWRDRDSYQIATVVPPGRLRTRLAVQRSAQIAQGKVPSAKPWRQTKRKHVEQPRLRVGILVDTSGSMSQAAPGVSSSLWVIANAVADAGGKAAAYAFGDSFARVLDPGRPPAKVLELKGSGGTAFVPEALQAAADALTFNDQGGPRLMIIVSDGMWCDVGETLQELERLRRLGVKTVHVMIGGYPADHGTHEICVIHDASDLAQVVGNACIRALKSA
jgi:hypothetical protein